MEVPTSSYGSTPVNVNSLSITQPATVPQNQEETTESQNKPSVDNSASKVQQFCKEMGIESGALIARQNSFKPVKWGQKILAFIFGKDTSFSENTHIATILSVNKNDIQILETHEREGGVSIKTLTFDQFQKYIKQGLAVITHETHTEKAAEHVRIFADNYQHKHNATPYAHQRFVTAPFVDSADSDHGISRTVHTFQKGLLMNSRGSKRSGAICSEVGVEILKLAQMSSAAKEEGVNLKEINPEKAKSLLQKWQSEKKVLNLDSHRTTPGTLVRSASEMGFRTRIITQSHVNEFERGWIDRRRKEVGDEISIRMKKSSQNI